MKKLTMVTASAIALSLGLAGGAFAGSKHAPYGVYGLTKSDPNYDNPRHRKFNHPWNNWCERGFYGENRCADSPNGRRYGPEAWDYATSTGEHIQR